MGITRICFPLLYKNGRFHCHPSSTATSYGPVCTQVDAADAQVVAGPDEAGLEFQRSCVRLHRLLAAVPVCKGRPQTIPQKVVLEGEASVGVGWARIRVRFRFRIRFRFRFRFRLRFRAIILERRASPSCALGSVSSALLADLLLSVLYRSHLTQGLFEES